MLEKSWSTLILDWEYRILWIFNGLEMYFQNKHLH